MSDALLLHLSKRVQEEIKVMSDDIARGSAKDFGEYKYACGIIRGLMMTSSILEETSKRMEQDDD